MPTFRETSGFTTGMIVRRALIMSVCVDHVRAILSNQSNDDFRPQQALPHLYACLAFSCHIDWYVFCTILIHCVTLYIQRGIHLFSCTMHHKTAYCQSIIHLFVWTHVRTKQDEWTMNGDRQDTKAVKPAL